MLSLRTRKIVCVHSLEQSHLERIRLLVPEWEVVHGGEKEWAKHLKEAEIVLGWNEIASEVLQAESKLRWVQGWGAGVDQMPLKAFAERGIVLTNASGVHAYPISETVFAMILALARKVHLSIRNQVHRTWQNVGPLDEIHGKIMGIIGVGSIGQEIARLAKAFGMNVLGVRKSRNLCPFVDQMYSDDELDKVLSVSDYVVVTLPLTEQTHHKFGRAQFQTMKHTAVFINIGRGGTTDTDALIEALQQGMIAGAGLDVFEQEPLPETSPLWNMENVVITPHNAGATVYYTERTMEIFLHNLRDYSSGRVPSINIVNLMEQY